MIDDRRRRDEQRLLHAQEIAAALRERRAELLHELRRGRARASDEPAQLDASRRARGTAVLWSLPDDVC